MTKTDPSSFRALQQEWYRRLEEEGFRDIEAVANNDLRPFRYETEITKEARAAYYRLLWKKAKRAKYDSAVDRIILHMFCDGARYKDIVVQLAAFGCARDRNTVRYVVRRYEMRWGFKEYTPRQLHKRSSYY